MCEAESSPSIFIENPIIPSACMDAQVAINGYRLVIVVTNKVTDPIIAPASPDSQVGVEYAAGLDVHRIITVASRHQNQACTVFYPFYSP
jgi:hypothetical protein